LSAPQSPPTPPHSQWQTAPSPTAQPYAGYQTPYGYSPAYGYPPEDPGKTLGIVGFVMAFVIPVVGIVLSAMGSSRSKTAGFDNQLAKWGLGLSIAFTVLWLLSLAALIGFPLLWLGAFGSVGGIEVGVVD
jgi:hypothetical protein